MNKPLLSVKDLSVYYDMASGDIEALQNINFNLYAGKTSVLREESGCGKSTLGRALLGLLPQSSSSLDLSIQA